MQKIKNWLIEICSLSVSDDASVEKSSSNVDSISENSVAEAAVNMDDAEPTENTSKDAPEENSKLAVLSNQESVVEKDYDEQTASSSNENIESIINDDSINNPETIENSKSSDCKDDQVISKEEALQDRTKNENKSETNAAEPVEVKEVQRHNLDETPKTDSETETGSSIGSNTVSIDELDRHSAADKATAQSPKAQNETAEKEKAETTTEDVAKSAKTVNKDNQDSTKNVEESRSNTTLSQDKNVDDEDRGVEGNDRIIAKASEANKGNETESNNSNEVVDIDVTNESKLVDAVDLTLEEVAINSGLTKNSSQKSPSKGKSILKGTLEKQATTEGSEHDMEMDDDFDPSLLCPDISMDVDEAPVDTNENQSSTEGNISPLPYEAIFSTLVDEITGAEGKYLKQTTRELEQFKVKFCGTSDSLSSLSVAATEDSSELRVAEMSATTGTTLFRKAFK
ncbi:hypothetical protein HUJ05_001956 [Dendroctonus ponderosae]|nr:hypothetical protein HUJ05_001956 [Dendroctonus ponderosae]